jgi:isocitrate lyase
MFELAAAYKRKAMTAYSELQQREFKQAKEAGYHAIKHQRFVGTGYFDEVAQCIAGGAISTAALNGSTEEHQFVGNGHN